MHVAGALFCAAVSVGIVAEWARASTALDAEQLADLWGRLGEQDASRADAAAGKLIAGGETAVAFVAGRLARAAPEGRRIARLIAALDADAYKTRQAASAALRRVGLPAVAALRAARKVSGSLEAKMRIGALLDALERGQVDHPEARRYYRAASVLTASGSIAALRATKALLAVAPTHAVRDRALAVLCRKGLRIVESLLADARAKSDAGDRTAAIERCRRALAVAVDADHYRKENIREIVDRLVAGAKVGEKMWHDRQWIVLDLGSGVTMALKLIPPGTFVMGSATTEAGRQDNEGPPRAVTITKPFHMGATEVTQSQWQAVMGTEPWKGADGVKEDNENASNYVSWADAEAFCKELSRKVRRAVRLPTEAQWEHACRASSEAKFCFGDDESKLGDYAWYYKNAYDAGEDYAHPVRCKKPNARGLYDMHGNVWEWCADYYDEKHYATCRGTVDPTGPAVGVLRVLRGGSLNLGAAQCRSACRGGAKPGRRSGRYGFRVVAPLRGAK